MDNKNRANSGRWGDFSGVVLARAQFCGLTRNEADPTKNPPSWTPITTSPKWIHSVRIAMDIVGYDGLNTKNPIGLGMYFRAKKWMDSRLQQEGEQRKFLDIDQKWHNIKDIQHFGGNTFFNYGVSE